MRGPKVDNPTKILNRVLKEVVKNYKFSFIMVIVCIIATAFATLRGTLFFKSLIDDYIVPLTK